MQNRNATLKGLVIIAALSLMACKGKVEMGGKMTVQDGGLKIQKGRESVTVPAGEYTARLEASKRSLQMKLAQGSSAPLKLEFKIRGVFNLPDNGAFTVAAADIGQEFAIQGTMVTTSEKSADLVRATERCMKDRPSCDNDNPHHPKPCLPTDGSRWVEYYAVQVKREVSFQLVAAQPLAGFHGQSQQTEREYTYEGPCM